MDISRVPATCYLHVSLKKYQTNMTTKPFVFTLMPFDTSFEDIYKFGIKDTSTKLGAYCERVDEQVYEGTILDRIINQISSADVIVADMTGKNPNVFFEVGYAKGIGKKIIFLTQSADDIPFDLKHYPHIVYNGKITALQNELERSLKFHLDNKSKTASELNIPIELRLDDTLLIPNEITEIVVKAGTNSINLYAHNKTSMTLQENSLQFGIIGKNIYPCWPDNLQKNIKISNNETMYLCEYEEKIFPDGWGKIKVFHKFYNSNPSGILKLYTEIGLFEYSFEIIDEIIS